MLLSTVLLDYPTGWLLYAGIFEYMNSRDLVSICQLYRNSLSSIIPFHVSGGGPLFMWPQSQLQHSLSVYCL